ncbi:MAG: hypothetical protein ACPGO4_05215 [Flavobacteriaceae bacterium]
MKYWLTGVLVLLFVQCGKEKIPAPGAAILVAPANNNNCTTAQIVDSAQSQVNFEWQAAENTDSYELVVQNMNTNSTRNFSTTFTSKSILLSRASSYHWRVISSAEITSETTTSEEWSFYLEGEASEEGLPFPAQLLAPENNATVNAASVTLSWSGGHPEGATLRYQVYLGSLATNLSAVGEAQTQSTYTFEAAAQQRYFWKIQSLQANGDSSDSVVFEFQTQ